MASATAPTTTATAYVTVQAPASTPAAQGTSTPAPWTPNCVVARHNRVADRIANWGCICKNVLVLKIDQNSSFAGTAAKVVFLGIPSLIMAVADVVRSALTIAKGCLITVICCGRASKPANAAASAIAGSTPAAPTQPANAAASATAGSTPAAPAQPANVAASATAGSTPAAPAQPSAPAAPSSSSSSAPTQSGQSAPLQADVDVEALAQTVGNLEAWARTVGNADARFAALEHRATEHGKSLQHDLQYIQALNQHVQTQLSYNQANDGKTAELARRVGELENRYAAPRYVPVLPNVHPSQVPGQMYNDGYPQFDASSYNQQPSIVRLPTGFGPHNQLQQPVVLPPALPTPAQPPATPPQPASAQPPVVPPQPAPAQQQLPPAVPPVDPNAGAVA